MTPEGHVKNEVKKILDTYKCWYFMPVSNGMGRHGIPDFIVCHAGYFVAIETKANGGTPTALQDRELQRIRMTGGVAIVINENNVQDLPNILLHKAAS